MSRWFSMNARCVDVCFSFVLVNNLTLNHILLKKKNNNFLKSKETIEIVLANC